MAYYNKIGLLVLNEDHTQMMVLKEWINHNNQSEWVVYKIIGWTIQENENEIECLHREVSEEIGCDINNESLVFIGEYVAPATGWTDRDVSIRLYLWSLNGTPHISWDDLEIIDFVWITPDLTLPEIQANTILKDYILPDLIKRKIITL